MKIILIILLVLTLATPVVANVTGEMTVEKYQKIKNNKESKDEIEAYIYGVGVGLEWANTWLDEKKQCNLFCPPKNLFLNYKNYVSIIDIKIKKLKESNTKNYKDYPIEMILFIGLQEMFPCR